MPSNITPPRVPMVDVKTGHIRREWFNFFTSLFELTGNGQNSVSLTDLQQAPPVIPYGVEGGGGSSAVEGRFYAYLGSTTALATSATNLIVLNTESYDETNEFDTSTGQFTATEDSVWTFTACVTLKYQADGNTTRAYIYVNGTDAYQIGGGDASDPGGGSASGEQGASSSITLRLSAGDTVDIRAYTAGAASASGGGPNYLYGLRLS